ncbi:heterokaryon incompatibility protein-domain-containing protein [Microdochium trichocladiopsis]|uniref:Heterokaryon incompatibility protein-domain-containing protein n=1 Tax=Microdochium trichocladiopsis TaxID=1682393 RepID=A0A9P8Y7R1_9PEZI|nr:heterokaryon incompatibility protein-domain-containing protein [Microdochium trichocladiopsis]KAH7031467.1 heterokaryon incompatibility protein-domain-containing protein [Microdochium trichocladiopsis]
MERFRSARSALLKTADSVTDSFKQLKIVQNVEREIQEWKAVDPFPYEPLPTPTSIRLIKLAPSKKMEKAARLGKPVSGDAHDDDDDDDDEDDDNNVQFVMHIAELDRNPQFTALSYTWRQQRSTLGAFTRILASISKQTLKDEPLYLEAKDPDEDLVASRKVTCNGHRMMVFENLFEALKRLHRTMPGVWLWIDAICMNQSDLTELTAQIQIMGRIYQSAQLVVVWLGLISWAAERGLKALQEMARADKPMPPYPWDRSRVSIGESAADDWKLLCAASTAFHLANRSWMKRVWVVQELCLARNITYLHGKHEIGLETLLFSCEWYLDGRGRGEAALWSDWQKPLERILSSHMRFLPTTLKAREEFARGNKWTLLQWFQACKGRLASVGKDYVFAGLSLVQEDCLSIDQRLQIAPTLPVRGEETTDASASLNLPIEISHQGSLDSQGPMTRALWPALVPNYSVQDVEVFVNAAACILTHATLEDLLRVASRLRDKHQFRAAFEPQPHEPEAFSGLPSWVPALGSWTSALLADLVPSTVNSPFAACTSSSMSRSHTNLRTVFTGPRISANCKILQVDAATFDEIASVEFEIDIPPAYAELRKLMRFLPRFSGSERRSGDSVEQGKYDNNSHHSPEGSASSLSFLELVACTMVAGQIAGQQVTPAQAGTLLCESITSKVQKVIAGKQRQIAEDQNAQQRLEVEAKKRGHDIDYLQTTLEDNTMANKWRAKRNAIDAGLDAVREITAELEALKSAFPDLNWPKESVLVLREQDVERARAERSESRNKRLMELREKRPFDIKSISSVPGTLLERGKMSANDLLDSWNDVAYLFTLAPEEAYRRVVSDECHAFEQACFEMLTWRRICLTKRGYIMLGPRWVDEGDSVLLLPNSTVPFVFARERDDLAREEARIKERLSHEDTSDDYYQTWRAVRPQLDMRLAEVQERLQQIAEHHDDHWVLLGEAYVQGVMQGEAVAEVEFGSVTIA